MNKIKFEEMMNKAGVKNEVICNLIKDGFLDAPASAGHHGNYKGGLFDHSLAVTESLLELTDKMDLAWKLERSPYIIGMFHDLCKIDNYKYDGFARGWEYAKNCLIPGHGEKSTIYLQKYIDLNDEEIACIRWHMGAFDNKENWGYYTAAVKKYPNVLWTHTADMVASQVLGV